MGGEVCQGSAGEAAPRITRLVTITLLGMGVVLAVFEVMYPVPSVLARGLLGYDFRGYLMGFDRWIATGSPYTALQLAGPYRVYDLPVDAVWLHPPPFLLMLAPFRAVPILWWIVPVGVVGYCLWTWRPSPLGWALVLLCAAWPRTAGALLLGNSDIWVAAGVAAGLQWGWPAVLILIKITFAPFALVGIRRRSWWIALAALAAVTVLMLPLWLQWLTALENGEDLSLLYSLPNLPTALLAMVAWVTRRGPSRASRPALSTAQVRG